MDGGKELCILRFPLADLQSQAKSGQSSEPNEIINLGSKLAVAESRVNELQKEKAVAKIVIDYLFKLSAGASFYHGSSFTPERDYLAPSKKRNNPFRVRLYRQSLISSVLHRTEFVAIQGFKSSRFFPNNSLHILRTFRSNHHPNHTPRKRNPQAPRSPP